MAKVARIHAGDGFYNMSLSAAQNAALHEQQKSDYSKAVADVMKTYVAGNKDVQGKEVVAEADTRGRQIAADAAVKSQRIAGNASEQVARVNAGAMESYVGALNGARAQTGTQQAEALDSLSTVLNKLVKTAEDQKKIKKGEGMGGVLRYLFSGNTGYE